MRAWLVLPLLVACVGGEPEDTDDSEEVCDGVTGTLTGWAYQDWGFGAEGVGAARVFVQRGEEPEIELRADDEGVFEIDLEAATGAIRAENTYGDCISEGEQSVDVVACEVVTHDIEVMLCVDG